MVEKILMTIPYVILHAKAMADSLTRSVEAFRSLYPKAVQEADKELLRILMEFGFNRSVGWNHSWDCLTTVVDGAFQWAHRPVPPPIDALREARTVIEAASVE